MIKYFLIFCALIFTVVGICEFIYLMRKLFTYPGIHTCNYSIVFLRKDYSIKQLKFLWQKLKWQGSEFAEIIIAITDNIENNEIDNCKQFITGKNIILCDIASLNEFFILCEENF